MDVPPLALHSSRENPTEGKEQLGIGKITMPAERYDNISNLFTHRLWSAGNTKFWSGLALPVCACKEIHVFWPDINEQVTMYQHPKYLSVSVGPLLHKLKISLQASEHMKKKLSM